MIIEVKEENAHILECFSSSTRIKIISLLSEKSYNIKEIAELLNISPGIVTRHVIKLGEAGIIRFENIPGKRGTQKICSLAFDEAILKFRGNEKEDGQYNVTIPVGQYCNYQVNGLCGLSTHTKIIGEVDDPRYFSDPDHVKANHLWFTSGFVEYRLPNYLEEGKRLTGIEFSMEICSQAQRYNDDWPSDISFFINQVHLTTWTSPGDFGNMKGVFTPAWWSGSQYGLLKTIKVNNVGTFIDSVQVSDVNIDDISIDHNSEILLRLACLEESPNCGGINLFGKKYGNHNQDIEVIIKYT
ncbi:ArsR family transcriptional regulator [Bacillus sp. JJ1533]|uniref:ArsR/SmtB family transcription factor n=1 Tax=Bacillus sp. JJ1533 TaxID=3122959 RepID=UPI002FFFE250